MTLTNIYLRQVESIEKKIIKLHEDLQYDFNATERYYRSLKTYLMQILGIDIGGTGIKALL